MKFAPGPDDGGPSSMFHDEGASTAVTGSFVSSRALITAGNGSRTSPVNEKPANWLGVVRFMRGVGGVENQKRRLRCGPSLSRLIGNPR